MHWLLFTIVVSQPVDYVPVVAPEPPRVIWLWSAPEPTYLDAELFE